MILINETRLPGVVVIVLNWNGGDDTIECLESLFRLNYPNYRVVVVDNGSTDESVEKILTYASGKIAVSSPYITSHSTNEPLKVLDISVGADGALSPSRDLAWPSPLARSFVLLRSNVNLGFAAGNNLGIRLAIDVDAPDYVFLLNNDTVVDPGFLSEAVRVAEREPAVGVVGAKILRYDKAGRRDLVEFAWGYMDWSRFACYFAAKEPRTSVDFLEGCHPSEWVSGAAMLIKVKAVPIRFLDAAYFLGCEDVDYCLRLASLGFRSVVALNAVIWHKGGAARVKRFSGRRVQRHVADTMTNLHFIRRHNPRWLRYLPLYLAQAVANDVWAVLAGPQSTATKPGVLRPTQPR